MGDTDWGDTQIERDIATQAERAAAAAAQYPDFEQRLVDAYDDPAAFAALVNGPVVAIRWEALQPAVESYTVRAYDSVFDPDWFKPAPLHERVIGWLRDLEEYTIDFGRIMLVGIAGFADGTNWFAGNYLVAGILAGVTVILAVMAVLGLP
jgi:hypothetical protein